MPGIQVSYLCYYHRRNSTYMATIHQCHRRTDGQTTYGGNTVLCATWIAR